jgi:hypothetical protein
MLITAQLDCSSNNQNLNNSFVFWQYEIAMSKTLQVGKSHILRQFTIPIPIVKLGHHAAAH